MRKYIYYSTLLGVFSGALIYRAAFDIRLFYLIILSNMGLLLLVNRGWRRVPRWICYLSVYLALSGGIGIARGTDTVGQFTKEFLGIGANAFFYYQFFRYYNNDYFSIFLTYTRISYWVAMIGFPILLWESLRPGPPARLHSIALEPAAFCELVLPAYLWYLSTYVTERRNGTRVLFFTVAIALAGSSLGYLTLGFGLLLMPFRRKVWLVGAPVFVAMFLAATYTVSANFRLRVDDTVASLAAMEVGDANLSTFSLVSNLMVTEQVLRESPWIGNGLGSHVVSHERIIGDLPGIEAVPEEWATINATEAGSLSLRLLSEQGVLGVCLVLWFIVRFHAGWRGRHSIVSNALLTCFFLKLVRGGMYFGPEQFFFVLVYLLNYRSYQATRGIVPLVLCGDESAGLTRISQTDRLTPDAAV